MKRWEGKKNVFFELCKKTQNKPSTFIAGLILSCTGGNPLPFKSQDKFLNCQSKDFVPRPLKHNCFLERTQCFSLLLQNQNKFHGTWIGRYWHLSAVFSVTSRAFDRNWTKTQAGELSQLPLARCPLTTFFTGQNLLLPLRHMGKEVTLYLHPPMHPVSCQGISRRPKWGNITQALGAGILSAYGSISS